MKNNILFTLLLFSISLTGFSNTWIINNAGNTFTPANITVTVGDTIIFDIANMHNAVEVSQAGWEANSSAPLSGGFQLPFGGGMILASDLSIGTHYFICAPHASLGMKGTITVEDCTIPAKPNEINGEMTVCESSENIYSVTPVSGATTYTWTLPNGWTGSSTTNTITAISNNTDGIISVTANSTCGSSPEETLSVSVETIDTLVIENDAMLTANASGVSYQWIDCSNNEAITGETSQSFQPTNDGSYAVIITKNGCSATSSCHDITIGVTGILENNSLNPLVIFPNPSQGKFQIKINEQLISSNLNVVVSNLLGEVIFQATSKNATFQIDLSNHEKGVYILTLSNGLNTHQKTLIRY